MIWPWMIWPIEGMLCCTWVLARLALMFIPFSSMCRLLSLLSLSPFRGACPWVWSLSGPISPWSAPLVPALAPLGGQHSPTLEGRLGGVCRGLEPGWRRNGGRWQIWRINTGNKVKMEPPGLKEFGFIARRYCPALQIMDVCTVRIV